MACTAGKASEFQHNWSCTLLEEETCDQEHCTYAIYLTQTTTTPSQCSWRHLLGLNHGFLLVMKFSILHSSFTICYLLDSMGEYWIFGKWLCSSWTIQTVMWLHGNTTVFTSAQLIVAWTVHQIKVCNILSRQRGASLYQWHMNLG